MTPFAFLDSQPKSNTPLGSKIYKLINFINFAFLFLVMDDSYNKAVRIFAKLKPFIAIAILIFIVISTFALLNYVKLQKEIKTTCGYKQSEDVYCVCDKSFVSRTFTLSNPYFNNSFQDFFNLSEVNRGS
jgi:hypothetical protein